MFGMGPRYSRLLLETIERIYAAQNIQEFTSTLLTAIPQLIPAVTTTYNEMDPVRRRSIDLMVPLPPQWAEELHPLWLQHMREMPVLTNAMKHRDGRARAISDFLSQRQLRNLGLYSEVFRRLKAEDALCAALEVHGSVVIGVGVSRDRRGFSHRERLALDLLRPHIAQARRNVRALTEMRERMDAMDATLAAMGCGVMDLDEAGRSHFVSPQTRALLGRHFGGKSRFVRGQVPEELRSWTRQARSRNPDTGLLPPRAPLVLDSEHGRLIIHLHGNSNGSRLLLREEPPSVSAKSLRSLGLTQRECEVLAWIAEGKTNAETAIILGISQHTVKRHVEDILPKLGVETRTAAASVAVRATVGGFASPSPHSPSGK
jgi:DNA-binding CsgD family transcriptional regulator/PAS domain-containing protein